MARIHGRNGRLYVALTSGGTPEPVTFLNQWSIAFATDKEDVTAFEDANKTYVAGLPDIQGDFGGYYDDATGQLYNAAVGDDARGFYLYPDRANDASKYWYGTAFFDFSVSGRATGGVEVSGSWAAASAVNQVDA